jgi:Predicted soluble lytic transglycosylase fused to an ABC-type amino acid-binding protein
MNVRRFLAVLTFAALPILGWSAERITLRNGFALICNHHAQVADRTRLYLSAGEDNFMEFPSRDISIVESVPDAAAPSSLTPVTTEKRTDSGKLSPADLQEMLTRAGTEHNLDVDLLASVVKAESAGNPRAVSRAGARGLMQLMPATANGLGVQDSYEPDQNVRGGSIYLDALLIKYHDNLALALAAYNAGPKAVDKYHGIPPYHETKAYVARVIHEFNRRVMAREAAQRAAKSNLTPVRFSPQPDIEP